MELHVPHGSIRSLREFLLHIGIVILGVIIALSLNQVVEAYHRSRMATEALEGFRREITFAESQVQQVLDAIPGWQSRIDFEIAKLSAAPAQADSEPLRYPETAYQLIRKASWDTAIATQILSALPADRVRGYELAYEELSAFVAAEQVGVGYWYELHKYGENAASLNAEDRRALIKELRRYKTFAQFLEDIGRDTLKTCALALK
jgi:hypothetical protein